MTHDEEILLEADDQPKDGTWVDVCETISGVTSQEMDDGEKMGARIDTENDYDSGEPPIASAGSGAEDTALGKARALKEVMLDYGVPEVSIELRPGRPAVQGTWDALFVVAEMSHHTVSRYGSNKTPVLALCKGGRSDLPGPLCNGYGGWDLCYRIITFGYANHPGSGGSITVPALTAGKFTIPRDSARRYAWGTEWEGGLSASDWDKTLVNPRNGKKMNMREFMGRSNMALEVFHEIHNGAHLEHSTWTSRKIDRLGYTQREGIDEKNRYKKSPAKPEPAPVWRPTLDLSNIQKQFKIARGIDKGVPVRTKGIAHIQRVAGLPQTGIVDDALLKKWGEFEKKFGGSGLWTIPDAKSLRTLAKMKDWKVKA